jgi:imidazolonepropionase-like amidohydrolase
MKYICLIIILSTNLSKVVAQETVYPAPQNNAHIIIRNGTIHIGNGTVIQKGSIEINNGKIIQVSADHIDSTSIKVIDATGKQVYPGLILPATDLGLKEIVSGVRGSNDFMEIEEINPATRSIVAYNTDSKIINVLKSNGILLACITPRGGTISGLSSVVQLDAWNWEDAAYKTDNAICMTMPPLTISAPVPFAPPPKPIADVLKEGLAKIEVVKTFLGEAKAYHGQTTHETINLKLQAIKGLFDGTCKLFVQADEVKQILVAIDLAKTFGIKVVIVGGAGSYLVADLLKQNNIAVILTEEHRLPGPDDEAVDLPYTIPFLLQKAGVLFALNDTHEESRYINLSYNAGTAAAYGLTKEEALQAITLNTAKILGIDSITGSLEKGKDANIVISEGDILNMKSSTVIYAFIQGRMVSLDNKQKQLYERYIYKYGLHTK